MRKLFGFAMAPALLLALAGGSFAKSESDGLKPKKDVEQIGDRDVDGSVNFYSLEKEIALGKQMADEVSRTSKIVDDPAVSEYVNRLGQNIVRNSDAKVPFTIKVIDNEEVNAFALPGGFLFVNTGLINLAENESELAGVLAHEIAHVAARHGTRQATRGQITDLATIPLIFLGGWTGYGIRQAAGLAVPMTFLKFSRGFEEEADFLGMQYLYAAGYDPNSMVEFFERLKAKEKKKPGTLSKLFSSHPTNEKRIEKVQKSIGEILPGRDQYVLTTSEFAEVKTRLAQLNARQRGEEKDADRPTLRRNTGSGPIEPGEGGEAGGEEENGRPTLKRRAAAGVS
jgi:predicted Zn-dependent protease